MTNQEVISRYRTTVIVAIIWVCRKLLLLPRLISSIITLIERFRQLRITLLFKYVDLGLVVVVPDGLVTLHGKGGHISTSGSPIITHGRSGLIMVKLCRCSFALTLNVILLSIVVVVFGIIDVRFWLMVDL